MAQQIGKIQIDYATLRYHPGLVAPLFAMFVPFRSRHIGDNVLFIGHCKLFDELGEFDSIPQYDYDVIFLDKPQVRVFRRNG